MSIWWSVALTAMGMVTAHLTGKLKPEGWAVGLGTQALWTVYSLCTGQPFFLVSVVLYSKIYLKNWRAWREREQGAAAKKEEGKVGRAELAELQPA